MRKSEDENVSSQENSAEQPDIQPEEDEGIIVIAPDPDYDADLDDDEEEDNGQGRKTLDLDSELDLAAAMKAVDKSLRKKKKTGHSDSGNGAATEPAPLPTVHEIEMPVAQSEPAETALRAQLEQERNNTLRAVADLHNFRRRVDEERKRLVLDANERLIKEILPVVDDFERSLSAAGLAKSYEQLVEGVEAVLRKIGDVMAREGLETIPAVGEPFDPTVHEAVMVEEGSEQPDETVIEELRKGYKMNGRVVRPSLVKVAKS